MGKEGREYPLIQKNCFFNKKNLQRYLVDAKVRYHKQEQKYHHDISRFYDDYVLSINNLPTENIFFSIHDVSDHLENSKGYRRVISVRRMIYGQFGVRLYCPKLVIYQFLNYCLSRYRRFKNHYFISEYFWIINFALSCTRNSYQEKINLNFKVNQFVEQEIIK